MLKEGDNGPVRIESGGENAVADLVLRAPLGKTATISGGAGAPISTDVAEKKLRIVLDARVGEIHTDCERAFTEHVEADVPTRDYTGEAKAAIDLSGVSEVVVLGKGAQKDRQGRLAPDVRHIHGDLKLDGDVLRVFLDGHAVSVWTQTDLEDYVYAEPV